MDNGIKSWKIPEGDWIRGGPSTSPQRFRKKPIQFERQLTPSQTQRYTIKAEQTSWAHWFVTLFLHSSCKPGRKPAAAQTAAQQKQKLRWTAEAQGDGITGLDPDPPGGPLCSPAQDFSCSETELSHLVRVKRRAPGSSPLFLLQSILPLHLKSSYVWVPKVHFP